MRVLGIDPGLKATGYGLIEVKGNACKLVETGTVQPKQRDHFADKLNKIYIILGEIIGAHKPDILVLEKLYAHSSYPSTASIMGHVRGVICLLCSQRGIELVEYSVKRIRQAVTGNGNASKLQTQKVVAHLLNIDEHKLTLDASDALALAIGYVQMNCRKP